MVVVATYCVFVCALFLVQGGMWTPHNSYSHVFTWYWMISYCIIPNAVTFGNLCFNWSLNVFFTPPIMASAWEWTVSLF